MKKQLLFLLVLFFLISGINMTYAVTYTWTGLGDGVTWTQTSNWSPSTGFPGKSPSTSDNVVFNSSASITMPTLSGGNSYTLNGMTLNNAGTSVTLTQTTSADALIVSSVSGLKINSSTSLTINSSGAFSFNTPNLNGTLNLNTCLGSFSGFNVSGMGTSATISLSGSILTIPGGSLFNNHHNFNLTNGSKLQIGSNSAGLFQNVDGAMSVTDSEIDIIYDGSSFSNGGTITFLNSSASSKFEFLTTGSFTNSGTVTATGTTFDFKANGTAGVNCLLSNNGTFNSTSCKFNETGDDSEITNLIGATFTDNASTFNCNGNVLETYANPNQTNSINNDGDFFALNGTQIYLQGNFTNLVCGGGDSGGLTLKANFVLGSKSIIYNFGPSAQVINNNPNATPSSTVTGNFILNSDKDYSATVYFNTSSGQSLGYAGKYYVQRFFTGKNNSTYRGYRLISSPVNVNSSTPGATNYGDFSYLNQSFTPTYTSTPTTTYNGIATGGVGGLANGFSIANKNPLLYLYNETLDPKQVNFSFTSNKFPGITSISGSSIGWLTTATGASPTSGTSQLPAGNGILAYYVGPNTRSDLSASTPPDDAVVTYFGYLNQGDVVVYTWFTPKGGGAGTLSYSSDILTSNSPGVNLVGNPYAAMIDLGQVSNDNPSFTTFYELNDAGSQQNYTYASFVWDNVNQIGLTSGANASRYVASGQGFFVKAPSPGGNALTFKFTQIYYDATLNTLTSSSTPKGVLVINGNKTPLLNRLASHAISQSSGSDFAGLHLMLKKDSTNFHETGIYFGKNYSDKLDKIDAPDLDGISIKTYLSSYTADGTRVAINGMGSYTSGKSVKLYVRGTIDGTYSLNLTDILNIDQTISTVNLIDNYKKDTVNLIQAKTYSFDILNADTNSYGSNRFILSVQRKPLAPYQLVAFTASKVNSNITVTWQTNNEGNYTGFGLQKLDVASNKFITIDSLQSSGKGNYVFNDPSAITGDNTYRLAQNNIDGIVSYSNPITIKYGLLSVPKALSIFPNPVKDNALLDFSGLVANQNGNFEINIYNTLGVLLLQRTSTTNFLSTDLSSLKPGIYVVQVKSSNGNILGKSTFIKN